VRKPPKGPRAPKPMCWAFLDPRDADAVEEEALMVCRMCRLSGLAVYRGKAGQERIVFLR
jgi:hypothetical protein